VQTTESGKAILMCVSQRPFTKESIRDFAARSLAAPATLVSDGLGCFTAVRGMGILHQPHVTGGGAASVKDPAFLAVNTVLGNIKTSLAGTITPSASGSTRIDTLVKCSTCSTAGSICARFSGDSRGRRLRLGRARCARFVRLSHLADQATTSVVARPRR
jgi:ISXO2-like transposase domain